MSVLLSGRTMVLALRSRIWQPMNKTFVEQVLSGFTLTPAQKKAALTRGCDVAVTAGAGSGKTSTLVARYACLLAEGCDVRKVVAITFTEKAAREMRSRARDTLS